MSTADTWTRADFFGHLAGSDYPDVPLRVSWSADCGHAEAGDCMCVMITSVSAWSREGFGRDPGPDGDPYLHLSASVFVRSDELDRLIATLQRARQEAFGQ